MLTDQDLTRHFGPSRYRAFAQTQAEVRKIEPAANESRCCGDCAQGRRDCECPDACLVPVDDERRHGPAAGFILAVAAGLAMYAVLAIAWLVLR